MALNLLLTRYLHGSTGSEVSLMNQTAFFFYIQTSEYKKKRSGSRDHSEGGCGNSVLSL